MVLLDTRTSNTGAKENKGEKEGRKSKIDIKGFAPFQITALGPFHFKAYREQPFWTGMWKEHLQDGYLS